MPVTDQRDTFSGCFERYIAGTFMITAAGKGHGCLARPDIQTGSMKNIEQILRPDFPHSVFTCAFRGLLCHPFGICEMYTENNGCNDHDNQQNEQQEAI